MANIVTDVAKGIKIGAEDILKAVAFVKAGVTKVEGIEPQVIAALGVLLGAVSAAVTGTAAAAAAPVNFTLDAAAYAAIKAVWPDVVSFCNSLGIQL